jgi:uncharacterized protein YkwD
MSKFMRLFSATVIFCIAFAYNATPRPAYAQAGCFTDAAYMDNIIALMNAARAQTGAPPVTGNPLLYNAALRHSRDMATGDFLSHTGSDGSEFGLRIRDAGYTFSGGGENVLVRFDAIPSGAYEQWWNSPGHRANMLMAGYVHVGIAAACTADQSTFYATMVLATPSGGAEPPPPPSGNPF